MERQDVIDRNLDLEPLTTSELAAVEGGVAPLIAVGFALGFAAGVGTGLALARLWMR